MRYRIIQRAVVTGIVIGLCVGGMSSNDIAYGAKTQLRTELLHALRPHPQATPDNTVKVEPGIVSVANNAKVEYAGGSSGAFAVVSVAGQSRIDLLVINSSGTIEIIQGTQAVSPTTPSYPEDKLVLAEVTVNETANVVINYTDIKDVRFFLNLGGGGTSTATENAYVNVSGDTMTGALNLPANGLVAGTNQLVISGGNVGIGTTSPGAALSVGADAFKVTSAGVVTAGTWNGTALTDTYVSDTLTASNLAGSGSTSNAVDLATAEVSGVLANANVADDITLTNITQITNRSHTSLTDIGTNTHASIDTHIASTSNPHSVTKTQVGLGSVDNIQQMPLSYLDTTTSLGTSNVLVPTQNATKVYVDNAIAGLKWKQSVRAATTANGALATAFANLQSIDGVTLATGDRLLIKDQTTGSENGIYTVNASGAPTRATDADIAAEIKQAAIFIEEGTTQSDTAWVCNNDTITLGTTALTFTQFTGAAAYVWGNGLTNSGNTINVGAGTGISVGADTVALDLTYTDGRYLQGTGGTLTNTLTFSGVTTDITTGANEHLALMPNGTGNVGIGTTGPTYKFHLNGGTGTWTNTALITTSATTGSGLAIESTDTGGKKWNLISTGTANTGGAGLLVFYDGTDTPMVLKAGNVGIGTTAPVAKLDVTAGDIALQTTKKIILDSNDTGDTYMVHDSTNDRVSIFVDGIEMVRINK